MTTTHQGPLTDIRVIDLSSGPVGGMATMVLGDFGADVIKVERPGGDPFRFDPASPMWLRGKRSVELDLKREVERRRLYDLVKTADVVLTSFRAHEDVDLGCDYDVLATHNPGIVYCQISGFGPWGPYVGYPGYEGVVAAKSGRMQAFSGVVQREGPQFAAVRVGSHAASQSAVAAVLAGLLARDRVGFGQFIETSLLQGMMAYDTGALLSTQFSRHDPPLVEPIAAPPNRMPTMNYHPMQTQDGSWIQFGNLLQHLFDNCLGAIDMLDIYADPRCVGSPATWPPEALEEVRDRMLTRMREKPAEEWMRIFQEHGGVAAHPYQTTQAALDDPDLVANGHVIERDDPHGSLRLKAESSIRDSVLGLVGERGASARMRQIGLVTRLTETPGSPGGPAPEVGQHTFEVLAEPRTAFATSAKETGNVLRPALDGVIVLEFATIIATPLGVSGLADLGARVIKVEPVGGDPYRGMGGGVSATRMNQGKESIGLDLKSAAGQEAVHRLIAQADVIIHNYRPGVPERLGIGYEQAKAIKPDIVYLSMNGYGEFGPSAHRPSTHPIPGAAVGGALMQAGAGMPPPFCDTLEEVREGARRLMRANEANPDPNTAMLVTTAAMLGLYAQRRLGVGQQVFVDMMLSNAYANADDFLSYEGKPDRPQPDAELYGTGPLYRLYRCTEGWVFLGVVLDKEWRAFCARIGSPELVADLRFNSREAREENAEALTALLADLFATESADYWEGFLSVAGLGCVRADGVMPGAFWLDDEHVRVNELTAEVEHGRWGTMRRHGSLSRFHRTPGIPLPAPLGGEQADAILAEVGYAADEIARLRAEGVVWSEAGIAVGV
ncbi:MAG: CoA transferase [Chloroflexi bacterium]|nr:CoA transferase [Chloroflexota bacterium]MDA1002654.1 CoA transferase [Chloroflexota bacterium]